MTLNHEGKPKVRRYTESMAHDSQCYGDYVVHSRHREAVFVFIIDGPFDDPRLSDVGIHGCFEMWGAARLEQAIFFSLEFDCGGINHVLWVPVFCWFHPYVKLSFLIL